jgi:MSHA biogenesis protein MshQ
LPNECYEVTFIIVALYLYRLFMQKQLSLFINEIPHLSSSSMSQFFTRSLFTKLVCLYFSLVIVTCKVEAADSYASSPDAGKVIINEINISQSYVELYIKQDVDLTGWTFFYDGQGKKNNGNITICSSSCNYSAGSFIVLNGVPLHNTLEELLVLDSSNKAIHYFRYANNANQGGGKWEWETDDDSLSTIYYDEGANTNLCSKPDGSFPTNNWQECDASKGGPNLGAVEPAELIAKYKLEESLWSGNGSILDSSGSSFHANPVGSISPTLINPVSCQAVNIPYNSSLATRDAVDTGVDVNTLGDQGSIAFWYRSNTDWDDNKSAKVLFDASTSSDAQFLMYIWPGGYLEFEATEPDGDRIERYTYQGSIAADSWAHIVVTWDATNNDIKIYVNGESKSLTHYLGNTLTQGLNSNLDTLYFGDNNSTTESALGGSADGSIDEVHLFTNVLTQTEVNAVYADVSDCEAVTPEFSCDATFTDGATSHSPTGSINFINNTYLYQGSDTVLASPTVNNNGWGYSCWDGGGACSASGSATTKIALSTFETTNNSATLTVENGTPQTIGNGSDNEFATITLNAGGELTTSNAQSIYKITNLISNGGTLRLSPGEYWVENLSIATGSFIYLNEPGEVKFYVKNDVTVGSYSEFNKSAASDYKLIFVGYSNITIGVATRIDALLYAQGDMILQNNAHVVGATSASNISFETSSRVNYQCDSIIPVVDHYQIIHDGNGLTCATETVTIKACSNVYDGTCTESTQSTSLNLVATGGSNTVTTATTFTGNAKVDFNYTLNETVVLSVTDANVGASNATVCNDNSSDSCNMLFASAGFIFTGIDDIEVAGVANSDVTIQAVKDVNGVCAGVFSNAKDVEFAIETISPSSVSGDKYTIGNDEINLNLENSVSNYKTISLNFGADSIASLSDNTYFDAGNIKLHAKHTIAATSENPTVTLLGSSSFYVRPYEFKITPTNSNNQSLVETAANGTKTQKAGADFNLLIEAVNLQGNQTVNFTNKSVELSLQRTGPTSINGGVDGTLTYSEGSIRSSETANNYGDGKLLSFTDGKYQDSGITYNEVGLFNMAVREQQTISNAANHALGSQSIGRFVPDHFTLTANMVENACDATNFTYMGQPSLTLTYEIEAQNLAGNLTLNYVDSFIHSTVSFVAENATNGIDIGGRLTDYQGSWTGGKFSPTTGTLNEDVGSFSRNTVPDGPYEQLIFGLKISDTDGSVLESLDMLSVTGTPSAKNLSSTLNKLRFGRWNVENSSGPETSNLSQPMYAQYLASSGQYITNTDDSCSTISSESNEVVLTDGSIDKDLTTITQETSQLVNGYSHIIELTAPNAQGDINVQYTVPAWLQFDWLNADGGFDGPYDQNPSAIATFGVFRGNDRIISWREVGN